MARLLSVRNLLVWFPVRTGLVAGLIGRETRNVRAVDGVSFDVNRGEVFCLVGESGCGKTTSGKAILRLNDVTRGHILFDVPEREWDLLHAVDRRLAELRGTLPPETSGERVGLLWAWDELARLKGLTLQALAPWSRLAAREKRDRLEKHARVLEQRLSDLRTGKDRLILRSLAKDQKRIEILRDHGSRFTPRRARRAHALEAALKEAQYRLRRAEALGFGARPRARKARRIERRLERLQSLSTPNDPSAAARIESLEARVGDAQVRLVERERLQSEAELAAVRELLEGFRRQEETRTPDLADRFARIDERIRDLRARGGPRLELWELLELRHDLIAQYDLTRWPPERVRELRRRMQIIYQDPYESLNPKMSIFDIVAEPLVANKIVETLGEAEVVVRKALEDVGLKPAEEFMFRYPHELSGGQRQRVGIATALVVDPDFIVADEPVSMLDASVRTEILALLLDLKKRRNLTYLFITHDLGLAWIIADRVAVMYLGKVVETGDGPEVIQNPRHPYTKALISVVPSPNPDVHREKIILRGERPNPVDIPTGCRFHPRCPMAVGICGWSADEVKDDLLRLFEEDAAIHPEAKSFGEIEIPGPFELQVATADGGAAQRYLRARIEALGSSRPALASIRKVEPGGGVVRLGLHEPVEPPLRTIAGSVRVACHLVEPEVGLAFATGAEMAAAADQSLPSTSPMAR
ncbi:MAG TPA: oligopeptide/dipeptide ABC transporter ATP-binding protein [Thermoplasmata archaeon]|nr:oligopeptide/dipeptide ABC transporter ATP-binding protein [Thermoplasmata archaeon]